MVVVVVAVENLFYFVVRPRRGKPCNFGWREQGKKSCSTKVRERKKTPREIL